MLKVIHLIPYDGTGGVETAARSIINVVDEHIDFTVENIFPATPGKKQRNITFNPFYLFRTAGRLVAQSPDLLIVSLWRSCFVALFVKLLSPRTKIVLFLHFPKHVHFLDSFFTSLTSKIACRVWADSQATLEHRFPSIKASKGQVISFLTKRLQPLTPHPVNPHFIFWGRVHTQKGLDKSLRIFAAIHQSYPEASYQIIGPDGGDLARLQRLVGNMGLSGAVRFLDEMDFGEIRLNAQQASLYLQTSQLEGMALSVVEAMQFGLVPVVTPVGEIECYCKHIQNSLIVKSVDQAVTDITKVLENNALYLRLRQKAIDTWTEQPLYAESVLESCREILGINTKIERDD